MAIPGLVSHEDYSAESFSMRLYFDTNVYDFFAATGEARTANRLIRSLDHSVLASEINLYEIYAIPDIQQKKHQLGVLTELATAYVKKPLGWLHARETQFEIGRCRPKWLKGCVFTKKING